MARRPHHSKLLILALAAGCAPAAAQAPETHPQALETEQISIRLTPRTPDQMAAFYYGRGFPAAAVDTVRGACFITVFVRNKSQDVLWLEPGRWRALGPQGRLERFGQPDWVERWERLGLAQRHRATFRWTLLPEQRDLRPQEPVGGNLTLERTLTPFTLEMRFATGPGRTGEPVVVRFEDVRCGTDPA